MRWRRAWKRGDSNPGVSFPANASSLSLMLVIVRVEVAVDPGFESRRPRLLRLAGAIQKTLRSEDLAQLSRAHHFVGIGACGGRKIFPAVFQLTSFLMDYGMSVNDAVHQARLDVSGTELVTIMDHIDPEIGAALENYFAETLTRPNGVSPNMFALPQMVKRAGNGEMTGGCFIPSPHAKVSAAS